MPNRLNRSIAVATVALTAVVAGAVGWLASRPMAGQTRTYRAPRTPDGKPDLNGIWQAVSTAHWDLQDHAARSGPIVSMGAFGAVPAGLSVVEGNEIPYQPWALAKKKENQENWLTLDPAVKCYFPGVPRATYMPFPFQIVQTADHVLFAYEFAAASRTIYVNGKEESPLDTWMGWSNGRWDGETLSSTSRASTTRPGSTAPAIFTAKRSTSSSATRRTGTGSSDVRSDHRGPQGVHAAVENPHAALSPRSRRTPSCSNSSAWSSLKS